MKKMKKLTITLNPPLKPRNGVKFVVLFVCRISGKSQDEKSLEDQEAYYREWLDRHFEGPVEIIVIATQGSGERLDRAESAEIYEHIDSRRIDLILTEDLGRIYRRIHALLLCEDCIDCGVRLISLNDNLDTAVEGWRVHGLFAVMRHEQYNADTAKRIRRTHRNRFLQQGLLFQDLIAGYIKPPGATSDTQLQKDPRFEPVYDEMFTRLEGGAGFPEISDWFIAIELPVGPYCRPPKRWTAKMVRGIVFNKILKGMRHRNDKISVRVNGTGRRKSVKAPPEELLERFCPHLVFIEPERYDRVIALIKRRNEKHRRHLVDGVDPRQNVARKATEFPGQLARCGTCGHLFYWTGTADQKMMSCSGCLNYHCWNAININGPYLQSKLLEAIWAEIRSLPEFGPHFQSLVAERYREAFTQKSATKIVKQKEIARLQGQIQRITTSIEEHGGTHALHERQSQLEITLATLEDDLKFLNSTPDTVVELPSITELQQAAEEVFRVLAPRDPRVWRQLRRLVPQLYLFPYQICDGQGIFLRAKLVLNLAALIPQSGMPEEVEQILYRHIAVDLFDIPQRVEFRERVVELHQQGLSTRKIAGRLGLTQPAVQNALALDQRMKELGLTEPFVLLTEPPESFGRCRRHKKSRYRFEPDTKHLPPPDLDAAA